MTTTTATRRFNVSMQVVDAEFGATLGFVVVVGADCAEQAVEYAMDESPRADFVDVSQTAIEPSKRGVW
jgi:hypothetical protein